METIWFVPGKEYFVSGGGGGAGIYHTNDITQGWEADTRQPVFYMFSIPLARISSSSNSTEIVWLRGQDAIYYIEGDPTGQGWDWSNPESLTDGYGGAPTVG